MARRPGGASGRENEGETMGASENKALVRRLFEQGMNERKAEIFSECVAPDFVNHDLPGPTPGPEGFLQSFAMFEAAFPDLQVHLDEVLTAEVLSPVYGCPMEVTHSGGGITFRFIRGLGPRFCDGSDRSAGGEGFVDANYRSMYIRQANFILTREAQFW